MIRLLVTGDLHIGRRPTRLPDERALCASCAAMWDDIVGEALAREVDAVLLSGDVIDSENRFYEAIGALQRGLERLAGQQIPTYAVAGNHDHDVLPQIADTLPDTAFQLLGRGGRWEAVTVEREGQPLFRLLGWSFPAQYVTNDPLGELPALPSSTVPTIGLLHCELDTPGSRYAPTSLRALQDAALDCWVIGHVHKPLHVAAAGRVTVLNPGSPQAMDPGEPGAHGPWLIETTSGGALHCEQLAISRVRYERIDIDLSDVDDEVGFRRTVIGSLHEGLEDIAAQPTAPAFVLWRVRLIGRTTIHGEVAPWADELVQEYEHSLAKTTARVEHVDIDTRPAIDLEELARAHDPPGTLARLLLDLEADCQSPQIDTLVAQAAAAIEDVGRNHAFSDVADVRAEAGHAQQLLQRQGWLLLDRLLAQKES